MSHNTCIDHVGSGSSPDPIPVGSTVTCVKGIQGFTFETTIRPFIDVKRSSCPTCWYSEPPPGITMTGHSVSGDNNNFMRFAGTATATGTFQAIIGQNCSGTVTAGTLFITFVVTSPTPTVTNTPPEGRKGEVYSHTITTGTAAGSAPVVNPIVTVTSGLPSLGLFSDSSNGAIISGVPTYQSAGIPINIHVTCDDNPTGIDVAQTIVIKEAKPFIYFPDYPIAIVDAIEFTFNIGISLGGEYIFAPDIAYPPPTGYATASLATSLSISPALPTGLSLGAINSNGLAILSGTPTGSGNLCNNSSSLHTLTASNNSGLIANRTFKITLLDQRTPIMPGGSLAKIYINEVATSVRLPGTQGCPITFTGTSLPPGMTITTNDNGSGPAALLAGTPTGTPGIYDGGVGVFHHPLLQITGTNAANISGSGQYSITVGFRQSVFTNPPPSPEITSLEWVSGTGGFSFDCEATNSPQTFTATGLPTGLSINASTGLISGTPSAATLPSTSAVNLTVTNQGAFGDVPADPVNTTGTITITLYATAAEITPVITSDTTPPDPDGNEEFSGVRGTSMTYQITGTHSPTSFGATSLPPGLTINTTTGLISGTPTTVGFFNTTVSATNIWGTGVAVVKFIISYPAPVISSILNTFGIRGQVFDPPVAYGGGVPAGYHITATVSDPLDVPPGGLIFSSTLIDDLTVDSMTGIISGTINESVQAGIYTIQLSASNAEAYFDVGEGAFVPSSLPEVFDLQLNVYSNPPTITSVTPNTATADGGVTTTITGTGFSGPVTILIGNVSFNIMIVTAITVTETELQFTLPSLPFIEDPYDIVVINQDGQAAIFEDAIVIAPEGISTVDFLRYTSLYTDQFPIYEVESTGGKTQRKNRIFGLGTNVEVMYYNGKDTANNKLLNVYRKQLGTTSTRHAVGDLVFNGILSLQAAPFMLKTESGYVGEAVCYVRSDGKIRLGTKSSEEGEFTINTKYAYASYQALLIKSLTPLNNINIEECE